MVSRHTVDIIEIAGAAIAIIGAVYWASGLFPKRGQVARRILLLVAVGAAVIAALIAQYVLVPTNPPTPIADIAAVVMGEASFFLAGLVMGPGISRMLGLEPVPAAPFGAISTTAMQVIGVILTVLGIAMQGISPVLDLLNIKVG